MQPKRAPRVKRKSPAGVKRAKVPYVADFETNTSLDSFGRVNIWAWGMASLDKPDYSEVEIGNTMEGFITRVADHNATVYFHNLKFDGHFILDWLLNNDYRHVQSEYIKREGTFKTLISDMGDFYSITVKWDNGHVTEFRDSFKKLPMTVARIATSFGYEVGKGEIDYHTYRPYGHELTAEEEDYLRRDVSIVAKAMKEVHDNGMKRLTVPSDSLAEFKSVFTDYKFKRYFPVLSEYMDSEIRRAYRGGFTYADPRFKGRITGGGLVLDVNSLYPSVMVSSLLPFGEPQWVDSLPELTEEWPLAIFSVTFTATLKENHIPIIQIKGNSRFNGTEYLSVIEDPVTLMVTNVDWELYQEHYDIDILEYGGGWAFHGASGLFNDYIKKWGDIKASSVGGKREIAKLFLNALYGKFASNPNVTSKIPKLIDGKIKLVVGEPETRPPVYTAMGVFITSYAREITIRAAQENYDIFAYADTDSLHLMTDTVPETIEVHPTKMGAWKLEYYFDAAYYVRAKFYLERHTDYACKHFETDEKYEEIHGEYCKYTTHIAGVPPKVAYTLTFEDMVDNKVLHGKLNPKTVPGGIILADIPFQIKL